MSVELVAIAGLVVVFLIATVLPVHMGALAFVAAFVVGTAVAGESPDTILAGFPGDLFLILVGVTLLFAIAKDNGTIDWLVHAAVTAVGGRVALIPWVMFAVTGLVAAAGAAVPASVAIIAPIGMGFAKRYAIQPVLMGLMIVSGSLAGGFSPLSVFGSIVNGVVERNGLPASPGLLFLASLIFNIALGMVVIALFGGRELLRGRAPARPADVRGFGHRTSGGAREMPLASGRAEALLPGVSPVSPGAGATLVTTTPPAPALERSTDEPPLTLNGHRVLTLAGLGCVAVMVLGYGLDVGFTAMSMAVLLSLAAPSLTRGAVSKVAWPTVLLICGIVTYVSLMERVGAIDFLGRSVARIDAPLGAAVLICYIGGLVSAFASTTGILGALIPLAVPFLLASDVSPVGMIVALSISSSVVDASPFSTSGALVVANAPLDESERVFRQLLIWGFSMVAVGPLVAWAAFVVTRAF